MGEQTQHRAQIEPYHDGFSASMEPAGDEALTMSTGLTNVITVSSPSKLPFRPRKIRKLSASSDSPDADYSLNETIADRRTSTRSSKNKTASYQSLQPVRIARPLSCDGEIGTAIRHLRESDPLLARLIDVHQPPYFDTFLTPFLALTRSILYQQLAYKAGTSIYHRFISLCGGEAGVLPETVLTLTPQQLRQVGVSGRKASYLHDLARKYHNRILSDASIVGMDDKSLFTMLTMVNGIGSWSVHMFMIFSLHRPDVLPVADLGVRKGVQLLYALAELPRPSQMEQLCEKWRPYRSVASWYLWRLVEAKGSPSSAAVVAAGANLHHQPHVHPTPPPPPRHQSQLVDPINSILNLGACAWGH